MNSDDVKLWAKEQAIRAAMESLPNFEGCGTPECGEHRTVGPHRAYCFRCTEWCYPDDPCARGALRAAGIER